MGEEQGDEQRFALLVGRLGQSAPMKVPQVPQFEEMRAHLLERSGGVRDAECITYPVARSHCPPHRPHYPPHCPHYSDDHRWTTGGVASARRPVSVEGVPPQE